MVWVLVALTLSALVYMIAILSEYRTYVAEIQPRIARTEKQAEKLGKGADNEAKLRDALKVKTEGIKEQVGEMKLTLTDVQKRIADLQQVEEQLEMDKYKSDFKKSKKA